MNRKQMQSEELENIDSVVKTGADDEINRLKQNSAWYTQQIDSKRLTLETIELYLSRLSEIISQFQKCINALRNQIARLHMRLATSNPGDSVYNAVSRASEGHLDLIQGIEKEIAELKQFVDAVSSNIQQYVSQIHSDPSTNVKRRIRPLPDKR